MRSAPDPVQRGDAAYQARHAFWQFYAALVLLVGLVAFGLAWLARRDDVRFEREEALGDLTEQAAIVRDVLGRVSRMETHRAMPSRRLQSATAGSRGSSSSTMTR